MTAAPNPRIRLTGWVLLVVGLLALAGALTGLDADGTGLRIALGVFGAVLLLLGLLLVRSRAPALRSVGLDARGLVVCVAAGTEDVLPWGDVRALGLRRVGPNQLGERTGLRRGGLILTVDCPAAAVPARLAPFAAPRANGAARLTLGLRRVQADALRRQLPDFTDRLQELPPTG